MESSVCVEQKGTVEQISGNKIRVKIHRAALCGDCHAKGFCFVGESNEREMDITHFTPDLKLGDQVEVIISQKAGNKAVILGYLVPFVILLTALIILSLSGVSDLLSGVISLSALAPYFLLLYMLRKRLGKSFAISARINSEL